MEWWIVLLNVLLALGMIWVVNFVGRSTEELGYTTLLHLYESSQLGYNVFLRVLAPPLLLGATCAVLYWSGLDELVVGIWLSVVIYWMIRVLYLAYRGWLSFAPKGAFAFQAASSILITVYFYQHSYSKGLDFILPQGTDVTFQLWLIAILLAYEIVNQREPAERALEVKRAEVEQRFRRLKERFDRYLGPRVHQDPVLRTVFYVFLMTEDFNRSAAVRQTERALFRLGRIKTTGIMQVRSDVALSDAESIVAALPIVEGILDSFIGQHLEAYKAYSLDDADSEELQSTDGLFVRSDSGYSYHYGFMSEFVGYWISEMYAEYRGAELDGVGEMLEVVAQVLESEQHLMPDTVVEVVLQESTGFQS